MIIIELILSLSVLVALSVISGFIDNRYPRQNATGKILQGLLFGLTAVVGMMYPFVLTEGIIFDGRSIVISLSTLFFGPITGLTASLIAIGYRVSLGGIGALTGSLVVASSFLIGLFFFYKYRNNRFNTISKLELYILGVIVHVAMMILMILLPSKNLPEVYQTITLTVLGIYPIITLIIGKILLDQEANQILIKKLKVSDRVFIHSMDMLCIAGFDGYFKVLNPAWEKTLGWSTEELLTKPWIDFVYKDDVETTVFKKDELVEGQQVYHFENRFICKDGNIKWLSWNSYPYQNEEIMFGVARDITEKKEIETELMNLSQVVKQSPASIIITDLDGRIEYVNPKFTEVTGYRLEEVKGENPKILKSTYKKTEEYTELWNTIKSGGEWRGEFLNIRKDKSEFWELASISPLKNAVGKIRGFIAVKEEITEKKKMEFDLQKALEKAEESDRIKSSLLLNMSHEFRTPMTGVLGMASILKENSRLPEESTMLEGIIQSGLRLMNTLDSVLEFAQLEADNVVLDNDIVFVESSILKVKEELESLINEKHLEFRISIDNHKIAAKLSERNLQIILFRLLDNAIKFTERGYIDIRVDFVEEERGNSFAKIRIQDSGIGISEKHYDLIFEEFRQVSEGTARTYEGTGLGLPIVKKIVDLANGKITVESKLGIGSIFTIFLPGIILDMDNQIKSLEVCKEKQNVTEELPEVLLVEDNAINKLAVISFLKNICTVDYAKSGLGALSMVKEKKYSLILMDINLGLGMDGIECSKKIRKIDGYQNTPIIAITGYSMESDKQKILSEGLTHYIVKPFNKKDLSSVVSKILYDLSLKT